MARCICCNKWTLKTPKQSLILSDKSTVCPSCCYDYGIHPYLQPKLANLSSKEFMQYLEKCKDQKNYLEPNFYLKPFLEIDVFRGLMRTHLYAVPISVHSVIDISISAKADSYEKIYEEVYFYDSFTKSSRKKNEHKSTCLYAEGTLTLWIQDEENRFPLKFTQSFVDYCKVGSEISKMDKLVKSALDNMEKMKKILQYNLLQIDYPVKEYCEYPPKECSAFIQYDWLKLDLHYKNLYHKEEELKKLRAELLNKLK